MILTQKAFKDKTNNNIYSNMSSSVNSAPNQSSVFYLEKPKPSIFHGVECREYPNFKKIYGFLEKGMGIKLRKKKNII